MAAQDNKAVARRFWEEVWNKGNLNAITDIVADDVVVHVRDEEDLHGFDGVRDWVNTYRSAIPDLRFTIEEPIAEGDKVATSWTGTGTHKGNLMGIPATGKAATVSGINIFRIVGGKITEVKSSWDALGMLQQLGIVGRIAALVGTPDR